MAKSIKFKNDKYLDSTSIAHNQIPLNNYTVYTLAKLKEDITIQSGGYIPLNYNDITVNTDNAYSNGTFVCKKAGYYLFNVSVYWWYGYSAGDIAGVLFLNGLNVCFDWRYYKSRGACTITKILYLNVGDKIEMKVYNASETGEAKPLNHEYNEFCVYKLL